MALPRLHVIRRSHQLLPFVLTVGCATGALGCSIRVDDESFETGTEPGYPGTTTPPVSVRIDAGASFAELHPGEGVGMFVEYAAGGRWRVRTTCDTDYSGAACVFGATLTVVVPSRVTGVQGEGLEPPDQVALVDSAVVFDAATDVDVDGFTFDTTPQAVVRLDMALDYLPQPRFVYWFGDGVLHTGAPTNPIGFLPAEQ